MTRHQVQFACIIILIGMFLVLITHILRTTLSDIHSLWVLFILGSLPNFGAALSIPFLMIVLATRLTTINSSNIHNKFFICLVFTFFVLTAWELIQFLIWGYPIDPNDIMATGIGVLFAISAHNYFVRVNYSTNKK
jgi:hypothetical protein